MVVRVAAIVLNVFILHAIVVELAEDLFRRDAQVDTQMVHQRQLAVFIDTGKQRHLRVGRAALHQGRRVPARLYPADAACRGAEC